MRLFSCLSQRARAHAPPQAAPHQEIAAPLKDCTPPAQVSPASTTRFRSSHQVGCCTVRGISCDDAAAGFIDAASMVNDAGFSCNDRAFAVVDDGFS